MAMMASLSAKPGRRSTVTCPTLTPPCFLREAQQRLAVEAKILQWGLHGLHIYLSIIFA